MVEIMLQCNIMQITVQSKSYRKCDITQGK